MLFMMKSLDLWSITALTLGVAAVVKLTTAMQVNSAFSLLSFAVFAFGMLSIYSTVLSSVKAKRKRAYAKIQRQVTNRYELN